MGLDTYANVSKEQRKEFINKCKKWIKKCNLVPKDVDIFLKKGEDNSWRWSSCSSRILANDISKVQGLDFPFSSMLNTDFNFYRDMSPKETLEMGKRAMEFLEKSIKELPKGHKIINGWMPDKNNKFIPAGWMDTKESLEYAKKQARWFMMIGECGYGTRASY